MANEVSEDCSHQEGIKGTAVDGQECSVDAPSQNEEKRNQPGHKDKHAHMAVSWISRLSARSIPNRMIKMPHHYTSEADSPLSARPPMNLGVSLISPQMEWPFQARPKKCRAVSSEPVIPLNCSLADVKKMRRIGTKELSAERDARG